jgi:translation elongation factor EF-Ts
LWHATKILQVEKQQCKLLQTDISVVSPDISESAKKAQFESGKEDLQNKPEEIRNKIVEGRIEKSLKNKFY